MEIHGWLVCSNRIDGGGDENGGGGGECMDS